ncbi:uncharacterized protein [Ptychodera flava]|uniref:uncharacterized protein n=1 Tax=Ptychodera flava TaxID=63121 RepID=UPI003969F0A0
MSDEKSIPSVKFAKFYESSDMKSLSELYTEDCKMMAPGMESTIGRKAVEELFAGMKTNGIAKLDVKTEEFVVNGEYAYEVANFKQLKEDGTCIGTGKYLTVLKKVDGLYYYHADIFNLN